MGEELVRFYKKHINIECKIAFISTFISCLLIHIYKFTNTLLNHDSVYNYYSDQNVIGSGRWALTYACGLSSYYDLPWINGLISCIFIALTVVIIVKLFKIKNPIIIILSGALLAASPSTTETFFFLFTADGYMISMFLATLAIYLSRIDNKLNWPHFVLSGILLCISCGIYQAYISYALVLAVCYFIIILLQNVHTSKECYQWILRQIIIFSLALIAYYIIWKVCLKFTNANVYDYQGISDVGTFSIGLIINGFISSIKAVLIYLLQWNILEHGFTLYNVLNILFVLSMLAGLIIAFIKSNITNRKWAIPLFFLCLLAIIPFSCIWNFTSDSIGYRPMMLQSLTLLFILTALLYEFYAKYVIKNVICILLVIIMFNNALMANISYYHMNLCYERTYADGLNMMLKITDLQNDYNIEKIAVLGAHDPESLQWEFYNSETGKITPVGKSFVVTRYLQTSLFYDANHTLPFLQTTFGLDLPIASFEDINSLSHKKEIKEMNIWPSNDSITVIDNIVVIKLSDNLEVE